MRKRMSLP